MAEFDWINRYFAPLARSAGAAGLTDDVAILDGRNTVITTDALVEGVHFLSSDSFDSVAQKLVRVNVSDFLAKGVQPAAATLTLGWSRTRDEPDLAAFADGLNRDCLSWGIDLLGGDTVVHDGAVFASLTLLGEPLSDRAPVRRSSARPGDRLWVTGKIGGGIIGLEAARAGCDTPAARAYRTPVLAGLNAAEVVAGHASAAMDISDGLIGDIQKLVRASGCGAEVRLDQVPLFAPTDDLAAVLKQTTGGDDFQILMAASPETEAASIAPGAPFTEIGHLVPEEGVSLRWKGERVPLPAHSAFEHD
ncbi:MAG: thiamine-phosphate kinase [Pseudomonadota bacterium]